VGTGFLGHCKEAVTPERGVVDERLVADDGAVGQRGDGRLEVQHLGQRHGDDVRAEWSKVGLELPCAVGVRPAAHADPHRAVVLEDVAAVEGARCLDMGDPVAQSAHGVLGRLGLGLALVGAGPADDRQVAVDHHGVLDEHGIGALGGSWDLVGGPACAVQR
jgi:hypothetical protein